MVKKTVEDLRLKLKEICTKTNTKFSAIEHLIKYYMESLHWTEIDSIGYIIELFQNGTIHQIKIFGKSGKEL